MMSHVVIIAGSPSRRSRLTGLTDYSSNKLREAGITVEVIHVADLPAEDLVQAKFDSSFIRDALAVVEAADAVIVATPVYKASYSGVLKLFLDLIPQEGLRGKLALPLVIGGSIAHLLAIDYALKPVLAALAEGIFSAEYTQLIRELIDSMMENMRFRQISLHDWIVLWKN